MHRDVGIAAFATGVAPTYMCTGWWVEIRNPGRKADVSGKKVGVPTKIVDARGLKPGTPGKKVDVSG